MLEGTGSRVHQFPTGGPPVTSPGTDNSRFFLRRVGLHFEADPLCGDRRQVMANVANLKMHKKKVGTEEGYR